MGYWDKRIAEYLTSGSPVLWAPMGPPGIIGPHERRRRSTHAAPGRVLAAEPADHGGAVLRLLRHRGGHRPEIRKCRHRRVRGHAVRRPRWPERPVDPHG